MLFEKDVSRFRVKHFDICPNMYAYKSAYVYSTLDNPRQEFIMSIQHGIWVSAHEFNRYNEVDRLEHDIKQVYVNHWEFVN